MNDNTTGYCMSVWPYFHKPQNIYHSDFSSICAVCILNKLQAVNLFLALDDARMHIESFTSGKKYRKLVNNAIFIRNEKCFSSGYIHTCNRIRAHSTVATQHYALQTMKYGLSNMGKYLSCRSMGNTMGEYTRYIDICRMECI